MKPWLIFLLTSIAVTILVMIAMNRQEEGPPITYDELMAEVRRGSDPCGDELQLEDDVDVPFEDRSDRASR